MSKDKTEVRKGVTARTKNGSRLQRERELGNACGRGKWLGASLGSPPAEGKGVPMGACGEGDPCKVLGRV